jgi:hypothetical protein
VIAGRAVGAGRRLDLRSDDGVYAIEMLGLLVVFVMIAMLGFQIAAIGGAATMAENAARAGSRAAGLGQDPSAAALAAVDPGSRDRTRVGGSTCATPTTGEIVSVCIDVPVVIPLIDVDVTTVERSAQLPARGLGRG